MTDLRARRATLFIPLVFALSGCISELDYERIDEAARSSGSGQCVVTPNPVERLSPYTITDTGFASGSAVRVIVSVAGQTATLNTTANSSGAIAVTTSSSNSGAGTVNTYLVRQNGGLRAKHSCSFTVTCSTMTTCAAQGKNCGSISDGCGGRVSCGSCPTDQVCGSDQVCRAPCTPTRTCASAGAECGWLDDDGCGNHPTCGACDSTQGIYCEGGAAATIRIPGHGWDDWTPGQCVAVNVDTHWPWAADEAEILRLVNYNRKMGAFCGTNWYPPTHPLAMDALMQKSIRLHVLDMQLNDYFSHVGLDGSSSLDRVRRVGWTGQYFGGENLNAACGDPECVVAGWMQSAGHCGKLMYDAWSVIGVGNLNDNTINYPHYSWLSGLVFAQRATWDTACVPTICAAEGKNCGFIPDGCGFRLDCGTCTMPETCGGGGVDNVCGGYVTCGPNECGTVPPDEFGGERECGACEANELCGLSTLNQCMSGPSLEWTTFADRVLARVNEHRGTGGTCGTKSFAPSAPLAMNTSLRDLAEQQTMDVLNYTPYGEEPWYETVISYLPREEMPRSGWQGSCPCNLSRWGAGGSITPEAMADEMFSAGGWRCEGLLDGRMREVGVGYAEKLVDLGSSGSVLRPQLVLYLGAEPRRTYPAGTTFAFSSPLQHCGQVCAALGKTCAGPASVGLDCRVHQELPGCNTDHWLFIPGFGGRCYPGSLPGTPYPAEPCSRNVWSGDQLCCACR